MAALWGFVTGVLGAMGELLTVLLGTILVLGLWFAWSELTRPRKEKKLRRTAATLGLVFEPTMSLPSLSSIPLFQKSREPGTEIEDVLRGTTGGYEIFLFSYEYQLGEGEHAQWPTRQTVAAFRVNERRLPHFTMKPKPFSSLRHLGRSGSQPHETFSRSYLLEGDDEQAIRSIFGPPVLEFFSRESGWWVEGSDEWLVIYKDGRRVARRRLPKHLERMTEIALLFPQHGWTREGTS